MAAPAGWILLLAITVILLYCLHVIRIQSRRFFSNRKIIADPNNLTVYKNGGKPFQHADLILSPIFKRCNFNFNFDFNRYFWHHKTAYIQFGYTQTLCQADELATLENILRTVPMRRRKVIIDNFFEYCLVSSILQEQDHLLHEVKHGRTSQIGGNTSVRTRDYFELAKQGINYLLSDSSSSPSSQLGERPSNNKIDDDKIPAVFLVHGGESCVVDAYNGNSPATISKKLLNYKNFSKGKGKVYIISSGIPTQEYVSNSYENTSFSLWQLDAEGKEVIEVDGFTFGEVIFNVKEFNAKYFPQLRNFSSEISYWQHCMLSHRIL